MYSTKDGCCYIEGNEIKNTVNETICDVYGVKKVAKISSGSRVPVLRFVQDLQGIDFSFPV